MKGIEGKHFAYFRILFGLTLFFSHLWFLPWSSDMYSNVGEVPEPAVNFTNLVFTWMQYVSPLFSKTIVHSLFVGLLLLSVCITVGLWRRSACFLFWIIHALLLQRNNIALGVETQYLGWTLLACGLMPSGEGLSLFGRANPNWKFPPFLYYGALVVFGFSYSFAGWLKIHTPYWLDGKILVYYFESNAFVRPLARDIFLRLPSLSLPTMAWAGMLLELLTLPMFLIHRKTRAITWLLLTLMWVQSIFLFRLGEGLIILIVLHFFIFDPSWLEEFSITAKWRKIKD